MTNTTDKIYGSLTTNCKLGFFTNLLHSIGRDIRRGLRHTNAIFTWCHDLLRPRSQEVSLVPVFLKMYECSKCNMPCIYRLRFEGGCDHTLCSECTVKALWSSPGHLFTCCQCCHESYCPICYVKATAVITETWEPPHLVFIETTNSGK